MNHVTYVSDCVGRTACGMVIAKSAVVASLSARQSHPVYSRRPIYFMLSMWVLLRAQRYKLIWGLCCSERNPFMLTVNYIYTIKVKTYDTSKYC